MDVELAAAAVDEAFVLEFAERWEAAWNSHQADRLLELMTEDVVYDDSAWPTTMRGHADVREFVESAWRAMPDLEFRMAEGPFLDPRAPRAAFYWTGSGTFTGPLEPPGFAPTGQRIEFDGFDLQEYRDGRVCRLRITFDMMDVSRQIGLAPKQGSSLEKAGAAVQRLGVQAKGLLDRSREREG
ncbi:MAG: ester cyclase [Thermoleophilaceae bacterium]